VASVLVAFRWPCPTGFRWSRAATHYSLNINQFQDTLHPSRGKTTLWGFTAGNEPLLVPPGVTTLPPRVPARQLTLNEEFDDWGRLIQRIGTNVPLYSGSFARFYTDTPRKFFGRDYSDLRVTLFSVSGCLFKVTL